MNESTYIARNIEIQAVEVAKIIDGKPSTERYFAVSGGIVEADAFLLLYKLKTAVASIPPPRRSPVKRNPPRKQSAISAEKPEPAKSSAPITAYRPGMPTLRDRIMALLEKGGCTSREMFEALHKAGIATTQGSVYQTCADLKQDGLIESRYDEDAAKTKYFKKS